MKTVANAASKRTVTMLAREVRPMDQDATPKSKGIEIETIREIYEPKISEILRKIASTLEVQGVICGGWRRWDDDEYAWSFTATTGELVDIKISIGESEDRDGINFMFEAVTLGGRVVASIIPYNFSGRCWISLDNYIEIEQRFQAFADSVLDSLDSLDSLLGV